MLMEANKMFFYLLCICRGFYAFKIYFDGVIEKCHNGLRIAKNKTKPYMSRASYSYRMGYTFFA